MAVAGWEVALTLAEEKGAAPIMDEEFTVTAEMLRKRPEMAKRRLEDRTGHHRARVLHARYSRYMQRVAEVAPELVARLAEHGARFTHHSSIAPTGTISLSLANNASNGIEPSFAHHYSRNVIREGKKSKEKVEVYSYELLAYRTLVNPEAMPYAQDEKAKLPDYFVAADDITPKAHVDIQAAAQKWVDSSISKTANVPTDYAVRGLQGHLPLRPQARPEGLHHVPLQPGRLPGRAGEGIGPGKHHLPLRTGRRHRGGGEGQRADRIRRRNCTPPPTCSTP
jgi:ribonucleoside-diphosphate reductase alpha chain